MQQDASPEQKPRGLEREKSTGEKVELSKNERDELNRQYMNAPDQIAKQMIAEKIRKIVKRRKERQRNNLILSTLSLPIEKVPSKSSTKQKKNKSQTLNPYGRIKNNAFYGDNPETVLHRANKNRDTQSRQRYFLTPHKTVHIRRSGKNSKGGGKQTRKYKY